MYGGWKDEEEDISRPRGQDAFPFGQQEKPFAAFSSRTEAQLKS